MRLVAMVLALVAVLLVVCSRPYLTPVDVSKPTLSFTSAIDADHVTVSAHRGRNPKEAIVTIHNRGSDSVDAIVPTGFVFASDCGYQPDVVVYEAKEVVLTCDEDPRQLPFAGGGQNMVVSAGQRQGVAVTVLSLEYGRQQFTSGSLLQMCGIDPFWEHVLVRAQNLLPQIDEQLVQVGMWMITDGIDADTAVTLFSLTMRQLFDIRYWLETAGLDSGRLQAFVDVAERTGVDRARSDVIEARLWDWQRASTIKGLVPKPGNMLIAVDVGIKNISLDRVLVYDRDFSLRVRGSTEAKALRLYTWDPVVILNSDDTYSATLVFEVELGSREFTLRHGDGASYFELNFN